ncbi:MAG: bifunctional 3,4-dihydroxy-2-butanone-4-phosphate synthase/GTP cyclohydrolase II [Gammaproteobacteria bacterium]|nr:bifunctional 3,4-dihydroxy-2-butanone-4-phosphate synthase/GTP cyclohydrolase II [Gammaproteobacteria bacterium]
MSLASAEEIIKEIHQGRMVVLMDDEDRENEGDLIMAASSVRAEDINFMATYGRGLICLTLTEERCQQLNLPLMVSDNKDQHSTNFTMSIEAAKGVTTGISAADRAMTVQAAVAPDAKSTDIVQPGHVFPLKAQPGGVLTRAGHTEAGCDLARLAGFEPAAVIVEILNEDGTMARRPDLEVFAEKHGLKLGTVADLIHYRVQNERTVVRVSECDFPTESGKFKLYAFHETISDNIHFALVMGEIQSAKPTLVRVHMENSLCDIFGGLREGCSHSARKAMNRIAEEGSGVVVLLRNHESTEELIQRIQGYQQRDQGKEQLKTAAKSDLRTFGIGAQILSDLGVRQMNVLGTPMKMHGLSGFELEVVEYVPFG